MISYFIRIQRQRCFEFQFLVGLLLSLKHLFPETSFSLSVFLSGFAFLLPLQELLDNFWIGVEFNSFNNCIVFLILYNLFQNSALQRHLSILKLFFKKLLSVIRIHNIFLLISWITSDIDQPYLPSLQCLILNGHICKKKFLVIRDVFNLSNLSWWRSVWLVGWQPTSKSWARFFLDIEYFSFVDNLNYELSGSILHIEFIILTIISIKIIVHVVVYSLRIIIVGRDVERGARILIIAVNMQLLVSSEVDHLSFEELIDLLVVYFLLSFGSISDATSISLILVINWWPL